MPWVPLKELLDRLASERLIGWRVASHVEVGGGGVSIFSLMVCHDGSLTSPSSDLVTVNHTLSSHRSVRTSTQLDLL